MYNEADELLGVITTLNTVLLSDELRVISKSVAQALGNFRDDLIESGFTRVQAENMIQGAVEKKAGASK